MMSQYKILKAKEAISEIDFRSINNDSYKDVLKMFQEVPRYRHALGLYGAIPDISNQSQVDFVNIIDQITSIISRNGDIDAAIDLTNLLYPSDLSSVDILHQPYCLSQFVSDINTHPTFKKSYYAYLEDKLFNYESVQAIVAELNEKTFDSETILKNTAALFSTLMGFKINTKTEHNVEVSPHHFTLLSRVINENTDDFIKAAAMPIISPSFKGIPHRNHAALYGMLRSSGRKLGLLYKNGVNIEADFSALTSLLDDEAFELVLNNKIEDLSSESWDSFLQNVLNTKNASAFSDKVKQRVDTIVARALEKSSDFDSSCYFNSIIRNEEGFYKFDCFDLHVDNDAVCWKLMIDRYIDDPDFQIAFVDYLNKKPELAVALITEYPERCDFLIKRLERKARAAIFESNLGL